MEPKASFKRAARTLAEAQGCSSWCGSGCSVVQGCVPTPRGRFPYVEGCGGEIHILQPVDEKSQPFQLPRHVIPSTLLRSSNANSLDQDFGKLCYYLGSAIYEFCDHREYVQPNLGLSFLIHKMK